MNERDIKLECLRLAGGNVQLAKGLYAWVMDRDHGDKKLPADNDDTKP